jgi:hypothetical protein
MSAGTDEACPIRCARQVDGKGERYIWLPRTVVDRLRALRGPGERVIGIASPANHAWLSQHGVEVVSVLLDDLNVDRVTALTTPTWASPLQE